MKGLSASSCQLQLVRELSVTLEAIVLNLTDKVFVRLFVLESTMIITYHMLVEALRIEQDIHALSHSLFSEKAA